MIFFFAACDSIHLVFIFYFLIHSLHIACHPPIPYELHLCRHFIFLVAKWIIVLLVIGAHVYDFSTTHPPKKWFLPSTIVHFIVFSCHLHLRELQVIGQFYKQLLCSLVFVHCSFPSHASSITYKIYHYVSVFLFLNNFPDPLI